MTMDFEALKAVWQRETERYSSEIPMISVAEIRMIVRKRNRRIVLRETLEALWGVAYIAILANWLRGETALLSRAGLIFMIAGIVLALPAHQALRLRFRVKRKDRSLMEYLRDEHDRLEAEISLERWYSWFYFYPVIFGLSLYVTTTKPPFLTLLPYMLLALSLGVFCYLRDRRKVRKELVPLRDEVDRQLHELSGNDND